MHQDPSIPKKVKVPSFFSYQNLRLLLGLIFLILVVRWSFFSPYHVPTSSMFPTIRGGDRLLANKVAYALKMPFTNWVLLKIADIQRGDIIIFEYPPDPNLDYVKRVVGIPGDRLRLVDDVLYINGQAQLRVLKDASVYGEDFPSSKDLFEESFGTSTHELVYLKEQLRGPNFANWHSADDYVVPPDSVFVLGDNRDESSDSRFWGEVPYSHVKGKAVLILWSMQFRKDSVVPSFVLDRFFKILN